MSGRPNPSSSSSTTNPNAPPTAPSNKEPSGSFECNICLELAQDPIVTLCGHLFCWPCLYEWLHVHAHSAQCPVCKAAVEEQKLVPLYGRGKAGTDPRARSGEIPNRPSGQRPGTVGVGGGHQQQYGGNGGWFVGGPGAHGPGAGGVGVGVGGMGGPGAGGMGGGRWGNYTFSAAIGGLFPLLSFQVHGFPHAAAYGPAAGFAYGYGQQFHGWHHAHGFPRQAHAHGRHQADSYLKALLILVGVLVVASLLAF